MDFQGELSWDLSADDFVRQSPAGDDFTSGGTFVNINDVASYQIWRSALGGDYELIDTVDGGQATYIDTGVESGVPYTYAVSSVDAAGNSSAPVESEVVSFGPPGEAKTKLPENAAPIAQAVTMRFSSTVNVNDQAAVQTFTTNLKSLLADLLGIPQSRIIIKGVRAGSVIVDFEITDDPDSPASEAVAQLNEVVATDPQVFADAGLGDLLDYEASQTTAIAFGEVEADGDASTTLSFTNSSTEEDAILIVSASVEGVGFFAFPEKLSLANGESGDIDVSFAAADVGNVNGTYTGTLTIITNDPNNRLMVISLSAAVVGGLSGAVADVSTQSISFPRTVVNGFSSREVTISNKGGLPLEVTISISGDDAFSLSDEGSISLDGGESQVIEVVFAPAEAIAYTGSVSIATDDPAHPQFEVALSGTGVPEGGPPVLRDPEGNEILGDFDGDTSVNFDDFFLFADNFGLNSASPNWDPAFDLNGDEAVNFDDFFIFADNFGKSGTYEETASAPTEIFFTAELDSAQEGGGFTEAGTGIGDFSYTDAGGLTYEIIVEGLTGTITVAHIHQAPAGVSGSPVLPLSFTEESVGVWVASGTWDSSSGLTPALVDELKAGNLYVNVHTAAHASGEIRGQIIE
ncbi:MAG: CHRD domain-containing protein [Candidatus Latescibacteria bacterium]|nr:CHRD domain-containing protein [Candidatus Latescibacterota bacterium]